MTDDCIFCRIARGDVAADTVYQDDLVTAFRDIEPQAKTHILVIPNQHLDSLSSVNEVDGEVLARILKTCALVAQDAGIDQGGYRVLSNVGEDGGQTVGHLHFHVLGGNKLSAGLG